MLDAIEREIDNKVKTRFPGAVRRVMLLQYGDDPEIEPGDLWVRVVPEADGPEDYERSLKAFADTHLAGIEQTRATWQGSSARSGYWSSPSTPLSPATVTAPG